MQIQISAEEVFEEYKKNIAEIHHELLLEKLKSNKLLELVQHYEQAEEDRVHTAAAQRAVAVAQRAQEQLPAVPGLPLPPGLAEALSEAPGEG